MHSDASGKLMRVLGQVLGVPATELTEETSMQSCRAWDSLKHIEVMVSLEEAFSLPRLTTDEIVTMTTVKRIQAVLREKGVVL